MNGYLAKFDKNDKCIFAVSIGGDYAEINNIGYTGFDVINGITIQLASRSQFIDFGNGKTIINSDMKFLNLIAIYDTNGLCNEVYENPYHYYYNRILKIENNIITSIMFDEYSNSIHKDIKYVVKLIKYNYKTKELLGSYPLLYDKDSYIQINNRFRADINQNNNIAIVINNISNTLYSNDFKPIDPSGKNSYVRLYLFQFDIKGNLLWNQIIAPDLQFDSFIEAHQVLLDDNDNVYICGGMAGPSFHIGSNYHIQVDTSMKHHISYNTSLYLMKFDANGNILWHYLPELSYRSYAHSLAHYKNKVYISGTYDSLLVIDKNHEFHESISASNYYFVLSLTNTCTEQLFSSFFISQNDGIKICGIANKLDSALRLTSTVKNTSGAAWRSDPVPVKNGFKTEFTFRMSEGWNDFNDGSLPGADGIAFVLQNSRNDAVGSNGGGIGYSGIPNSLAIEFDTYKNDFDLADPDGNHVAVFCSGASPNTFDHSSNANLATNSNIITMKADSTVYYAKVDYNIDPGKLRVWLDTTGEFLNPVIVLDSIKLDKLINLKDDDKAFVGFTSSTGNSYENHDILSWWFCPVGGADSIIGVKDLENPAGISLNISPNPAGAEAKIEYYLDKPEHVNITLVDMLGSEIAIIESGIAQIGFNRSYINLTDIPTGVYIIKLQTEDKSLAAKLVIWH
ncbi:MAG: hypothetical protein QG635_76, partial [Bacteroidota bacterium]|nr:hypothetical protein [Bacteroidota bacterium]